MSAPVDVLAVVRRQVGTLSKAEARVASTVLAAPSEAMHGSIGALAAAAGVSEPSVARFCRSVGWTGFAAFKLALAQSLGRGVPWVSASVEPDDPPERYAQKILRASITAIEDAAARLDPAAIAAAVRELAGARQIVLFGSGGSGSVAADAQHKLARLGVPTVAHADPILQLMAAATLGPEDVLVAISTTGRTRSLIEGVTVARDGGTPIVALTAPGSPLAALAAIVIAVEPAEDSEVYTAMGSRLAHLALIDVMATGAVLARGAHAVGRLARIKTSLAPTRVPA